MSEKLTLSELFALFGRTIDETTRPTRTITK